MIAVLGSSALVASACGGASDTGSAPAVEEASSAEAERPADLEAVFVSTASGGQLDFNSLSGQDVLLWFWAPW